jgi:hypothetical protein
MKSKTSGSNGTPLSIRHGVGTSRKSITSRLVFAPSLLSLWMVWNWFRSFSAFFTSQYWWRCSVKAVQLVLLEGPVTLLCIPQLSINPARSDLHSTDQSTLQPPSWRANCSNPQLESFSLQLMTNIRNRKCGLREGETRKQRWVYET